MPIPPDLEKAALQVHHWKTGTLLTTVDERQPKNFLAGLAAGEVREAEEQQALENTLLYNFLEHAKEITDIFVFLFSFCQAHGILPDFVKAWSRSNGQGAKSPIYDQLYEKAINLSEGDIHKNVQDFLSYIISLTHHLPQKMDIVLVMHKVIQKNMSNRPREYYSSYDKDGKLLTVEELMLKYVHVEKMLRLLRDHFGSPLEKWMHERYQHLIIDFRHGEVNYSLLKSDLVAFDAQIAHSVMSHLLTPENASTRLIMHGLRQAGAVDLAA